MMLLLDCKQALPLKYEKAAFVIVLPYPSHAPDSGIDYIIAIYVEVAIVPSFGCRYIHLAVMNLAVYSIDKGMPIQANLE